nr:feruloyl-CoA synthase-like [Nerophis lumbriciformis]
MESERWAGGVDCVGGDMLATLLAQTKYGGVVTACGLAGSAKLSTTVMPFILRGVALQGIDSVMAPLDVRQRAWATLGTTLSSAEDRERLSAIYATAPLSNAVDLGAQLLEGKARSRQAASALHDLGVWQGDQVALLMRNDFAFFEATLGASLLGASPVPLNWHLNAEEIAHILDDCGAKVLVAHADLLTEAVVSVCDTGSAMCAARRGPGLARLDRLISGMAEAPRPVAGPMFYTSGTTGMPKGVKRKSASAEVIAAIGQRTNAAWGFDQKDIRSIMSGPLYHSAPNAYGNHIVRSDGLLVLQPRFDAEQMLAMIAAFDVTHLHLVPTMFVRLLALADAVKSRYDLSSLKFVTHGSAPCPPDVKQRMINWWGPVIHEYYAMTEIGIATACTSEQWLAHRGTVGNAGPGVDLKILDDDGEACAPGTPGEICVRSETTTRFEYHRDHGKTDSVRLGDFVATGDVGFLDEDGFLFISDRKTDMVISGGVNIYPAEIEKVLLTMDHVRDCVVFGIPDAEFGERLVAVVESAETLDGENLAAELRSHIASYKVPREYFFADNLPREDSGKIKKRVVRKHFLAGTIAVADHTATGSK